MIGRVVFDTSTVVSAALRPDSIPYQALHRALRYCDVCASKETLAELKRVLAKDKFRRYIPDGAARQFVRMMENNVRLFVVRDLECLAANPPCRDPADNKFLALAFECDADAIVSCDEDLLVLHPWDEIRILRPAEFLNEDQ
ncbi:MAG: putative toxin-antitoxin system toxin component, PIN family [Acidobacteriaceae bacterium]